MEEGREIAEGQPSPPTRGEVAPEREIGDEEVGTLLSAFGNHEVKALTLAAMMPGIIYTRSASEGTTLSQELRKHLQGKRVAWIIYPYNLFNYCRNSFSHPLTIVAEQAVDSNLAIYGYKITDYGIGTGQALAGHLLEWSLNHDKSLIEVFGSTFSGGQAKEIEVGKETVEFKKRAPITRLKIFRQILASPFLPIRQADLINTIGGTRSSIEEHLINLDRFGIIDYQSTNADESFAFYRLAEEKPDKEPEPYRLGHGPYPTLTGQVYNLFISDPNLKASPAEVYQQLIKIYPAYKERKQPSMKRTINSILSHLQKQGYLKREGFRQYIQSEISLTEDQRIMLSDLLQIMDRFQSGDREFWQEGRRKAQDILADPEKFAKLMNKAHNTSPGTKRIPPEDLEEQLVTLLSRYPNSTTRQLQEYLNENTGKSLTGVRLRNFLRTSRRFVPQKKHTAIYWTVKTD